MSDANVETPREGPPATASGLLSFAREWLLRREALAGARSLSPTQHTLRERARAAMALGDACMSGDAPEESLTDGAAPALALSLYREAAHWALAARSPDAPRASITDAFDRAAPAVLTDETDRTAARAALVERTYVETAELSSEEQSRDASTAGAFVHALLDELDARERLVEERWTRVGSLLAAALLLFVALPMALEAMRPGLAERSPWRASSASPGFGRSGRGFRAPIGSSRVFFHTDSEPSPWVEFDLGGAVSVTEVTTQNRGDCCQDRAVPLVVELSTDGRVWVEVARRAEVFDRWTASFPSRAARFVRLRAQRPTMLHLSGVEIR